MPPEEFEELIRELLLMEDAPCIGKIRRGHLRLFILSDEQHYWSPQLGISYEEHEKGTLVRGLYGPRPSLWAMFFYGYAICSLIALFTGMWGLALFTMGKSAWPLWFVLIAAICAVILYLIAQTGQKLGAEQTFTLHHFFEDAVGERTHIE
jgi:hypothetical protein